MFSGERKDYIVRDAARVGRVAWNPYVALSAPFLAPRVLDDPVAFRAHSKPVPDYQHTVVGVGHRTAGVSKHAIVVEPETLAQNVDRNGHGPDVRYGFHEALVARRHQLDTVNLRHGERGIVFALPKVLWQHIHTRESRQTVAGKYDHINWRGRGTQESLKKLLMTLW